MRPSTSAGFLAALTLAMGLILGSAPLSLLRAQELGSEALRNLALQGTWQADFAEYGFWDWNDDGTVCLRVGTADGNCADTGTWELTGNVLCYELGWWGETVGERENCVTVQPLGDARFETLFHGGEMVSRMFAFTVLE